MTVDDPGTHGEATDHAIVQRVLRGDRDAYAILVDRHQRRIVVHAARVLGNRDEALEVAHETFIKAYLHLARYDPAWKFTTWLHAIAGNLCVDHLRTRKRRFVSLDEPVETEDGERERELPGPARMASEEYEGLELAQALERAIAELPPIYRDLLLLRHPGGLSYEEIATACSLPLGTVKARIFRARQRLKDLLGDRLPADVREDD